MQIRSNVQQQQYQTLWSFHNTMRHRVGWEQLLPSLFPHNRLNVVSGSIFSNSRSSWIRNENVDSKDPTKYLKEMTIVGAARPPLILEYNRFSNLAYEQMICSIIATPPSLYFCRIASEGW